MPIIKINLVLKYTLEPKCTEDLLPEQQMRKRNKNSSWIEIINNINPEFLFNLY